MCGSRTIIGTKPWTFYWWEQRPIRQWFFLGEVVTWMENASCVQPHVHKIHCKLDAQEKESAIYKICNNSKASLKLKNKVY